MFNSPALNNTTIDLSPFLATRSINSSATSLLLEIQAGHLHWFHVLERLSADVPVGIRVENLATKNYNVYLIGQARSRDGLLEFKAKLEQDDCFETVNVPLSNLVVKENVDFQMDFLVKQNCLRE